MSESERGKQAACEGGLFIHPWIMERMSESERGEQAVCEGGQPQLGVTVNQPQLGKYRLLLLLVDVKRQQ